MRSLKRGPVVIGVAVLLVLTLVTGVLAATGIIGSGGSGDDPVTAPPTISEPPSPPPGFTTPRPGMANVADRPFQNVDVAADDVTLTIGYYSGVEPCYVLDRVEVEETAETVTITLYEGSDPTAGPDSVCPEIAEFKKVQVVLDAPLGDREIVDGADDRRVPITDVLPDVIPEQP